jgi:hypothetical protein
MQSTADNSRKAAQDYSPRRKPWAGSRKITSPKGAKENLSSGFREESGALGEVEAEITNEGGAYLASL